MLLNDRIAGRLGCPRLTRDALDAWQLGALRETVRYAAAHSPFYARLADIDPKTIKSTESLPFIDEKCLADAENPSALLCVPQGEIARVTTLRTSGTSGVIKRLFFTSGDLENTIDFFANGIAHIPGTRTLIGMSGDTPGSVGTLLTEALRRIGRTGIIGGPVADPEKTLKEIRASKVDSLVGHPAQALALARHPGAKGVLLKGVLLSGDHASDALIRAVSEAFGCPVFRHYGMAEAGYGAAVECERRRGQHIREADLLFEIVDTRGKTLPDGEWGEVVATTLTRRGMPLIRYRTGDLGRFLPGLCECGSILKRLEVRGRLGDVLKLPTGEVHLSEIGDALDPLPWLSGFEVSRDDRSANVRAEFCLHIRPAGPLPADWRTQIKKALETIVPFRDALSTQILDLKIESVEGFSFSLAAKRTIRKPTCHAG